MLFKESQYTKKLYMILLFPIIGILLFAAIGVKDKVLLVAEMKQIEELTKLTNKITEFIHETQRERGKTSVYLYSFGTEFSDELKAQYKKTNTLQENVIHLLSDFNIQEHGLQAKLRKALSTLEQITRIRQDVLSLNIPMQNAIDYYSGLNAQFLQVISILPNLSDDSKISTLSNAYINFLNGKEKAGIERAIISGILTAHQFSQNLSLKAIAVSAEQQMYFDNFTLSALLKYLKLFDKAESSTASQNVSDIRKYVHQQAFQNRYHEKEIDLNSLSKRNRLISNDKSLEPNVLQWFTFSTNRINSLKNIEDSIAQDLQIQTQKAKLDAFYSLVFYSVLVLMASVMALVIPVIFNKLQLSREKLVKNIDELNLTRDELVQSEKIGALGRMVAGFAHEVNTPIGIAVGSVSQIQQSSMSLQQLINQEEVEEQDLIDNIDTITTVSELAISNLSRAARLVQSFKRTSVDQVSEKARRYNVKDVLDDVVFTLNSKLNVKKIKVELSCPMALTIFGQPGRFDQLITNLIINSIAHAFDDSISDALISIKVAPHSSNLICLSYTDNGKGMDESEVEKIFEPFYTTSRTDGTGLGMYICHNIAVNDMNGHIRCESSIGHGILFEVTFPSQEVMGLENES